MPALARTRMHANPAVTIVGVSGALTLGTGTNASALTVLPVTEMFAPETRAPVTVEEVRLIVPFWSTRVPKAVLLFMETFPALTLKMTWLASTPLRIMLELVREMPPETLKTNVSSAAPVFRILKLPELR